MHPDTAPVIDKIEGHLTSPFGANFTVTGTYSGDVLDLTGKFTPNDGSDDVPFDLEDMPQAEDKFIGEFGHEFTTDAMYPITSEIIVENTQTGESDSESFEVDKVTLAVKKNGTGKGTVTAASDDTARIELINCDPDCPRESAESVNGTFFEIKIKLVANATTNSIFTGWSDENGNCKGTDPCFISFNKDYTITATFEQDTSTSSADLSFSFLETDSPVAPGENTSVKATITNNGPDTAKQTGIELGISSGEITETPKNLACDSTPAQQVECLD